jgi:curved DNA-binding protein CbpA
LQHPGTPRAGHKPKEPDAHKTARQGVQQEAAQELVQEINEAYGVLSDPDRRRALDRDFGGGLYEKSERCARESLALRRLLEDQSLAARALNKLGEVQQASGRARLAIKSFEEAADKGVHARVLPQAAGWDGES